MGTYNPATGKNEFVYISTPAEINMGTDIHHGLEREYTFSSDPAYLQRIQRVGERIALISDRQDYVYQFYVIEKDDLNAFTVPGGRIYVFAGLLDELDNDDQLAAVIAHEVGHCAARHAVKKFQAALGYDLIGRILLSQIDGGSAQTIARLSSGALMSIVFSAYSRKDEYEADRLGIKYMYLAGYKPEAAIDTFMVLKEAESGARTPQILRTHPYMDSRIEAVKHEIERVKSEYGEELVGR